MAQNTAQKLQHELNSMQGLSIINILCCAFALAFGVSFLFPNLIEVATTQTVQLTQIGLMALGGLAFVVAIRWLIASAEIIDAADNLKKDFAEHKKNQSLDDDALTGLIVKMAAAYRENKSTLKLMMIISKIAGICFAAGAVLVLIQTLISVALAVALWSTLAMVANAAILFAMAAACFIIPHFFGKYAAVWDRRLQKSVNAEVELEKQLAAGAA
jgi:hypothetical protein